ncbi:unnamed protein product [Protopolystoma xenopodis]|uniref:Uncharacterized protein n=1 Tax=Protopolystoma xenopodis TaxID=117903 RepID=A0A3S5BBD2_9PLAT|nr:unnamed protein product [Protopolystoma xenopodis]
MDSRILHFLIVTPLDFVSRPCDAFRYFGSFSVHVSAQSLMFLDSQADLSFSFINLLMLTVVANQFVNHPVLHRHDYTVGWISRVNSSLRIRSASKMSSSLSNISSKALNALSSEMFVPTPPAQ